jgi:tetraacyldisaccharide 4'-kinase
LIDLLYAAAVRRRRERYAARPDLRRRLRHPVVSVGNLAVGGRGKTPTVATIARLLLAMGERPAILSRGHARRRADDGVVVVRDPLGIRGDLDRSGDEPLMLARQLPGASVVVCADRFLAGRLAEHHLGATVHVLDDGFQHLQLDRDADIVLLGKDDVARPVTLPTGRLREPIDTLLAADAILVADDDVWTDRNHGEIPVFRTRRTLGPAIDADPRAPVLAVAGIARPQAFFAALRADGWQLAAERSFRDHYRYSPRDLSDLASAVRASGAAAIVTTEKDYVRLLPFRPFPVPLGFVPLTMEPDPLPDFRRWLAGTLDAARDITRA